MLVGRTGSLEIVEDALPTRNVIPFSVGQFRELSPETRDNRFEGRGETRDDERGLPAETGHSRISINESGSENSLEPA
jgi:hypothetical protein